MQQSSVPSRDQIRIGQTVWGIEKQNYRTGQMTEGVVARILTNKRFHPRGIKVQFEDGTVVRVQSITPPSLQAVDVPADFPTEFLR